MATRAAGRQRAQDLQASFRGGLNTTADESQVAPDEVREAQNARLTEYGGITKRLGTQRVHETSLAVVDIVAGIKGGFTWRKTTPPTHFAMCEGHLFSAPHGAYPFAWSDLGSGFDSTALVSFASFRDASADTLYIADGGQLCKYKGGIVSLNLGGTPNISRLAVHNLRLFACGDASAPETIYYSGLSNGDTLGQAASGGGSAIVRTFAHEPLTGLLPVGQSLLLFHERGISRFTGWSQDDFNISEGTRGVTQDVGTIAPNSIVGVENVGFFMSDRGGYAVTESGVQAISAKIEATLSQVPASDLAKVSGVHNRAFREVWFFIPNLGVMVYNYRLQSWSGPLVGVYLNQTPCLFWESGAGATPQMLFGGADAFVRQADVSGSVQDDVLSDGTSGVPYTMSVRCHRMFFGDPTAEKSLRYIYLTANLRGSTGTSIGWNMGDQSGLVKLPLSGSAALWKHVVWNHFTWGRGGSASARVHAHGRGRYADVRLLDDGVTNPVFSRVEADGFALGGRF